MELQDKVAVVTGAASGIGAAIVRLFVAAGARVVAVDTDTNLTTYVNTLAQGRRDQVRSVVGDVSLDATARAYTGRRRSFRTY